MAPLSPQGHLSAGATPVRAWALSEWSILPLRLFLGVTFAYAGLNKLANPNFFLATSPTSIQAQLAGAARVSPIHGLLHPLVPHAVLIGWLIAYGELAIGLGTLAGLKTRVAAAAGALLSLSLFLTVSFHASPYFTGADIVFLFAWSPLLVAGGGSRWSLDALIAQMAARSSGVEVTPLVVMPFATVQSMCGHFDAGSCRARDGAPCVDDRCPVLLARPTLDDATAAAVDRRALVLGTTAVALAAGAAVATGASTSSLGHLEATATAKANTTPTTSPTTTVPGSGTSGARGVLIGPARSVPVGSAATFTVPSSGDPGLVVHLTEREFVAYDAVCPHMGCTVAWSPSAHLIACPCHGSQFAVLTGQVIQGPAPHGLSPLNVVEESNGDLYLK